MVQRFRLPARLIGHRETGGQVELLLLRDLGGDEWECLVKPGKRARIGMRSVFGGGILMGEVTDITTEGNR